LFTNLESDTPPRIRLLAKFVENDYEKVERLLEMREAAESKLRSVDKDIASERRVGPTTTDKLEKILTRQVMAINEEEVSDEDELEWYSRRLDAGLSSLQNADYVLAWVCMEEDGVSFSLLLKGAQLIA
jgi:beta-catenin-like protein 1